MEEQTYRNWSYSYFGETTVFYSPGYLFPLIYSIIVKLIILPLLANLYICSHIFKAIFTLLCRANSSHTIKSGGNPKLEHLSPEI